MTDSKTATELLPCPFCGSVDIDEYEGDYGNGVYCMNCGAMMGEPIHHEYRVTERVSIGQAIEAWNTRTPEQAIAATLGSGTCCLYYGEDDDGYDGWYCDECGGWFQAVWRDGHLVEPKHCQECGKAVKR